MENLKPTEVFSIFNQIVAIPRASKHERQISDWLVSFAQKHQIEVMQDEAMNVIMRVPATSSYESRTGIILQAHMDMVCEKESSCNHNFATDPINTYVEGDFIHARGTTLGGDDGIGMAMALAVLSSKTLPHPPLEALFTVDEETGLTGANLLKEGCLRGRELINLDSEDDGQIFVGCAGGVDTVGKMYYNEEGRAMRNQYAAKIHISGLIGGHSGDEINKGRANANKLLVRLLYHLRRKFDVQVSFFEGGNLRNAIAREASCMIIAPLAKKEDIRIELNHFIATVESEYQGIEDGLKCEMETVEPPATVIKNENIDTLIRMLYGCPHGVIAMSRDIEGLVETSTNLASVRMKSDAKGNYFEICTSQRSSVESRKKEVMEMVSSVLELGCEEVKHGDGYPGWKPNMASQLLKRTIEAYVDLFGQEPVVKAIHAGLECGLFLEKYPYLDMVSIGPQMYNVHSPQERLSISSTERCWRWLCRLLEK